MPLIWKVRMSWSSRSTATIGSTVAAKGLGEVSRRAPVQQYASLLQGGLLTGLMAILIYDAMVTLERRLLRTFGLKEVWFPALSVSHPASGGGVSLTTITLT